VLPGGVEVSSNLGLREIDFFHILLFSYVRKNLETLTVCGEVRRMEIMDFDELKPPE